MKLLTVVGVLASVLVAAGCGSDRHGLSRADVQAYAALAQRIGSSASAYGTEANATVDPTACHSAHASYDAQVHPMLARMRAMSGAMDQEMSMMGHGLDGDMSCGADAMAAELAHHDAVACTSTMTANHDEATRHAAAMVGWAGHQHARATEMNGMMGGGGMMGSGGMMGGGGMMDPTTATTTMACHRNGDGTFTLRP